MNINEKLKEIKEFLISGAVVAPDELCSMHRLLGGQYAFLCDEMAMYENIKSVKTEQIRETSGIKSDAQAERKFNATLEGQSYQNLKYGLKAIGKMMASINKSIDIAREEKHGQKFN